MADSIVAQSVILSAISKARADTKDGVDGFLRKRDMPW